MIDNNLLDINLKLICETKNKEILAYDFLDKNNRKIGGKFESEKFADEMELKGLIRIDGELCILTDYGSEIYNKYGGWLKYNRLKEIEEKEVENNRKLRETAELENLTSNTMLNRWLLKTKYLPHILSFISILVSIIALYCTIQSDNEKKQLKKRIIELELSEKKINYPKPHGKQ